MNTSRKRRRRDADIRSAAAAAARRSVTIGSGGVSKMSAAAARRRRRTALGQGYHYGIIFELKIFVGTHIEHYDGLMRLFSLETKRYIPRPISLSPQDFRDSLCIAGGAFGTLFAVDQKAKIQCKSIRQEWTAG